MGFYIRKSVRFGPIRFNLSGHGIGASVGLRGFRVGMSSTGRQYLNAGGHGLYYHANLGETHQRTIASQRGRGVASAPVAPSSNYSTKGHAEDIISADVSQMQDSSVNALLAELSRRARLWRLAPAALLSAVVLGAWAMSAQGLSRYALGAAAAASLIAWPFLIRKDIQRKTTDITYELSTSEEASYQMLTDALGELKRSQRLQRVPVIYRGLDRKHNAGVTVSVKFAPVSMGVGVPPNVATNVKAPFINLGDQTLFFLPDFVLAVGRGHVGGIDYQNLTIAMAHTRFVEKEGVPGDAETVGETWEHPNKNGGPDRRFSSNRKIPVALYTEIELTSTSGLNHILMASRTRGLEVVKRVIDDRRTAFSQHRAASMVEEHGNQR